MRGRSWRISATVILTGALLAAGLPAHAVGDEAEPVLPFPEAPAAPELPPASEFDAVWKAPAEAAAAESVAVDVPESAWEPQAVPSDGSAVPGPVDAAPKGPQARSSQAASASAPAVPAPGLGALPWFAFDERPLSTNTVARVNLGNGNLLLTGNDGVLNSAGLAIRNDRFYNGLTSTPGSLGSGWSSAFSAFDVGLRLTNTDATYVGPNGFRQRFVKSGSSWTTPAGFNATLTGPVASGPYPGTLTYTLTYNSSGETMRFNASGWLMEHRNRNGVGYAFTYVNGEVTEVRESTGRFFTVQWGGYMQTRRITKIEDFTGRATTYSHDSTGRLTGIAAPGGFWEQYDYDASGRISQFRAVGTSGGNATNVKIDFGYDAQNRVTSIRQGTVGSSSWLRETGYAYTAGQTVITDARGNTTTYAIDAEGRATGATDALGRTRSQTYTPNSDVATTLDALGSGTTQGNTTTYKYDQLNNRVGVEYPTGAAASATYAVGSGCNSTGGNQFQLKCTTSDAGNTTEYDYDTAGNVTATTDTTPGGTGATTQQYSYAAGGGQGCDGTAWGFAGQICTSTDGNGNVTKYRYDASGNLTTVTPPAPMGETVYTHDTLGRIATVTDGNGDTTAYQYNARDEIVSTVFDNGQTMTTNYWSNGIKSSDRYGSNDIRLYYYDPLGQLERQTIRSTMSSGVVTQWNHVYTFDPVGNLLSFDTGRYGTTSYTYDAANQLAQVIEPDGTCGSGPTSAAASGCIKFTYDANGAETSRALPGGTLITTTRDAAGRATRITAKDGAGATKVDIGYSFQAPGTSGAAGDRGTIQTRTSHAEEGIPAGAVTAYSYDSLNRLTNATEKTTTGATNASFSYAYDNAGNRISRTYTGALGTSPLAPTAGSIDTTVNAANQITATTADRAGTTWTYDAAGSLTSNGITGQTAAYNDRGSLASLNGGAATYGTFGQGNADTVTRTVDTVITQSPTGAIGAVGEDYGQQRITTRTPTGEALANRTSVTTRYYFVTDALGSVAGLFSRDGTYYGGYTYSPYGEARNTAPVNHVATNNKLRYIAGYWDETADAYRLGARYYDPGTGRFTQHDPSGQEANPYGYAACNPIDNGDPTGLNAACAQAITGLVASSIGVAFAVASIAGLAVALASPAALTGAALAAASGGTLVEGIIASVGTAVSIAGVRQSCA